MKSLLKKALSVSMCALLLGGSAVFLPAAVPEVSAAEVANEAKKYLDFEYAASDKIAVITKYTGQGGAVVIPETIEDKPVCLIADKAFSKCTEITSITLPDSVWGIGYYAFSGCSGLKEINIPDSVTTIGEYAFSGCSSLTGFTFPKNMTSISFGTFHSCESFTSITIPDNVKTIDHAAFYNCSGLTEVNISEGVEDIGKDAFCRCSSLKSITVPDSVTSIGGYAFSECSNLTEIKVKNNNKEYSSEDGILFTKKKDTLIRFPESKSGDYYNIPDTVKTISSGAFEDCDGLKEITIPNSVTSIGARAFDDCSNLRSMTIPDSVTSISDYFCCSCNRLNSVTIPNSVTSIGRCAFYFCTGIRRIVIPESVTDISYKALGYYFSGGKEIVHSDYIIYGKKNSAAEKYSNENGIKFVEMGGRLINTSTIDSETVVKGSKVSLRGSAKGGAPLYTYTFRCRKSGTAEWEYLSLNQPYSLYEYKGTAYGEYEFQVIAKDTEGTTAVKNLKLTVTHPELENISTISETSITDGSSVTISITPRGGVRPYSLAYRCKRTGAASWTYIAANTLNTSMNFTPSTAGTYDIQTIVKDSEGKTVTRGFKLNVKELPLVNESSVSSTSIETGTAVTLTAKASGGIKPYTYTYRCKKSDATSWKYLAANTTNAKLDYKPASTGTYDIQVIVKDADGKTATKGFTLTVKDAQLINNSTISTTSTTLGKSVTLTAKATGGKTPYTYTFRCKKTDATSWKYLAANTTTATLDYKPASTGTYDVQVIVKDAEGKTVTKGFKLTVK